MLWAIRAVSAMFSILRVMNFNPLVSPSIVRANPSIRCDLGSLPSEPIAFETQMIRRLDDIKILSRSMLTSSRLERTSSSRSTRQIVVPYAKSWFETWENGIVSYTEGVLPDVYSTFTKPFRVDELSVTMKVVFDVLG